SEESTVGWRHSSALWASWRDMATWLAKPFLLGGNAHWNREKVATPNDSLHFFRIVVNVRNSVVWATREEPRMPCGPKLPTRTRSERLVHLRRNVSPKKSPAFQLGGFSSW